MFLEEMLKKSFTLFKENFKFEAKFLEKIEFNGLHYGLWKRKTTNCDPLKYNLKNTGTEKVQYMIQTLAAPLITRISISFHPLVSKG